MVTSLVGPHLGLATNPSEPASRSSKTIGRMPSAIFYGSDKNIGDFLKFIISALSCKSVINVKNKIRILLLDALNNSAANKWKKFD